MKKYEIIDHFLYIDGQQVEYRKSPNSGGEIEPILIVVHYTGDNSLGGALSWLCSTRSSVSAHVVIAKDGTIYQLLPFNIKAWHAGSSSYNDRPNVNSFSVGIENVGFGDEWPEEQIEANRALIVALFDTYPIVDVVGHEDVAPGRKEDPGPNFPWHDIVEF